jgi:ATP-dependent Clp protease ATP-binding subunit ClpA
MDSKLQKAIDLIEEAGGIVMMQSTEESEAMMREAELIEQTATKQAEEAKYKADAFEEFDEALGSKNFSMNMVDDICYENGIDLDDIEEYIFSHY